MLLHVTFVLLPHLCSRTTWAILVSAAETMQCQLVQHPWDVRTVPASQSTDTILHREFIRSNQPPSQRKWEHNRGF